MKGNALSFPPLDITWWQGKVGYSRGMTALDELSSKPGNDGSIALQVICWREALRRFLRLVQPGDPCEMVIPEE